MPHFSRSLLEVGPFQCSEFLSFIQLFGVRHHSAACFRDSTLNNVPWNLTRYYGNNELHFITCSCYRRQPLVGTARWRDLFLKVLEQVREKYQFVVIGYVVIPNTFIC